MDLGTRTGWALLTHGRLEHGVQVFDVQRGESPGMRYRRFSVWLEDVIALRSCSSNTEERAWAAGFFDGEGYIGANPAGNTFTKKDGTVSTYDTLTIGIGINQAGSPELLERFQKAVGRLGVVNGPYVDKRFTDARHYWHYAVSGLDRVRGVVEAIWPWLGSRKREQASEALNDKLLNVKRAQDVRADWMVVYEAPHQRGGAATEVAAGFSTRVQEMCARHGIEHAAVHTGTLKKFTTGSGSAKKPAMIAAVQKRWAGGVTDDNEADAIALLYYALSEMVPPNVTPEEEPR